MIALLHYAILKTRRDRSLFIPLFMPGVILAALIGVSIAQMRFVYPLAMSPHLTRIQNATLLTHIVGICSLMFGTITAFWTYRAEVATRAISSFVVASRAMTVVASLVLFGTLTVMVAWISGVAMVIVLTATIPPHLPLLFAGTVAVGMALIAVAIMLVFIAPRPENLIWSYLAMFAFVRWMEKLPDWREFALAAALFVVCTTLSTFFLRRRCAT